LAKLNPSIVTIPRRAFFIIENDKIGQQHFPHKPKKAYDRQVRGPAQSRRAVRSSFSLCATGFCKKYRAQSRGGGGLVEACGGDRERDVHSGTTPLPQIVRSPGSSGRRSARREGTARIPGVLPVSPRPDWWAMPTRRSGMGGAYQLG